MGEVSVLHFSCFVWRSISHWKSCPRGCSTIRDLNSLPSSLASVKLLRSLSQKWVTQILISPLKNVNYHDGNRKVIQQLSLSAGLWASSETVLASFFLGYMWGCHLGQRKALGAGSSPQLATPRFCSSLSWLTALLDQSKQRELETKCSWRLP